ncbi:ABC transporter ATPase [Rhodanobacter sp. 115]|nr:ABC transporter ATPase [Rhodanobacter sp. 115]
MLSAEGLQKRFKSRQVVRDFGFSIRQGEVVGLLGPNGAGKTTCFYMVVGLIEADGGTIKLDKQDITGLPMHARAKLGIGYLPQEASVFRRLSVSDNILAVLELREGLDARKRAAELESLLDELKIAHIAEQKGRQPVRRRAPSRGDRPRAGRTAALHAAGRAVRRRRSDLGGRDPAHRAPPEGARHRRADHRPQRARNTGHLRPCLHPQRRRSAVARHPGAHSRRREGARGLPGPRIPALRAAVVADSAGPCRHAESPVTSTPPGMAIGQPNYGRSADDGVRWRRVHFHGQA